ncbi:AAA family ATPase [Herpetosiphon llansteffanensis]|uniref:AAA family ATPase n=1 Tax=Herpetosiphon llansteffanensis TaxID=2094568 RepID=UPI000D7C9121|nr:ATP-binding protein [Herpetosiphon llansteffanensis]
MIHSITFRRWKSFLDTTLYLDQIMVLIGMNASGKSNVLDALSLLKALADGEELEKALSNLRGGAEFAPLYGRDSFELEVEFHQNETDKIEKEFTYKIRINIMNNIQITAEKIKLKESGIEFDTKPILFENNKLQIIKDGEFEIKIPSNISIINKTLIYFFSEEVSKYIKYINNVFTNILNLDVIPKNINHFAEISDLLENDGSNLAGVLAALDDAKRQKIEQQLTEYLTRLPENDVGKVWVEKIGLLGRNAMLYCEETWPNGQTFNIDSRRMSDGTLRFLAILTALLTRPEGSNLIIEEVDNGLHPSRAKLLLEMLREIAVKRQIDVLVTTHNPALLDAMTPDYIGFITVAHRNPQGYSELTLLDNVDALPKLLASGGVGYLATTGKLDQAIEDTQEQGE